ncbi:MAG: hypothetical protein B6D64_05050 [Bacteroidetes bacterium 4484_276]|nr:MAG: hypothetical protein B6D64_05050 [Bacteroidetes bacterium 4484_276]
MKNTLLFLTLFFCSVFLKSQDLYKAQIRFIEVTGSAELEIEPDEIRFIIGIKEYWKEEFDKRTKFKDYKTKVPISVIEKNLVADLAQVGIQKDNLIFREVGNYFRYNGKEFLISKQIELILYDFKTVNEITMVIDTKGIDYMRIGELKNKEITEFRKQVKIEALKAAKEKAKYLLASIDKEIGDVISITEMNSENNFLMPQSITSNTIMGSLDNPGIENIRKIKLRYEIKAKFEIK